MVKERSLTLETNPAEGVANADLSARGHIKSRLHRAKACMTQDFDRVLVSEGTRILIRSKCAQCGVARIVSKYDDSLDQWENSHCCETIRE